MVIVIDKASSPQKRLARGPLIGFWFEGVALSARRKNPAAGGC